jgi:hypothetical protein
MLKVPLKVLIALVAALLALGVWWGFVAVSRSLGTTGDWIGEWSVVGWIAYGLLAVGLDRVIENLFPRSAVGAGAQSEPDNDPAARARRLYVPGMWGKGGSAVGNSDLRS